MTDVQELVERLQASLCPNKLQADIESALQQMAAEVERLTADVQTYQRSFSALKSETDALQAKMDEAQKQEPIGYLNPKIISDGVIDVPASLTWSSRSVGGWTMPIYTRPIPAQDVNAGLVDLLREAVATLRDNRIYGSLGARVEAALSSAQAAPARVVPLTRGNKLMMFNYLTDTSAWGGLEFYLQGVEDAEHHHGIAAAPQPQEGGV